MRRACAHGGTHRQGLSGMRSGADVDRVQTPRGVSDSSLRRCGVVGTAICPPEGRACSQSGRIRCGDGACRGTQLRTTGGTRECAIRRASRGAAAGSQRAAACSWGGRTRGNVPGMWAPERMSLEVRVACFSGADARHSSGPARRPPSATRGICTPRWTSVDAAQDRVALEGRRMRNVVVRQADSAINLRVRNMDPSRTFPIGATSEVPILTSRARRTVRRRSGPPTSQEKVRVGLFAEPGSAGVR